MYSCCLSTGRLGTAGNTPKRVLGSVIKVIKELVKQFSHAMPRGRAITVVPQLVTVTGGLEKRCFSSGGGNLRQTAKRKVRTSLAARKGREDS